MTKNRRDLDEKKSGGQRVVFWGCGGGISEAVGVRSKPEVVV